MRLLRVFASRLLDNYGAELNSLLKKTAPSKELDGDASYRFIYDLIEALKAIAIHHEDEVEYAQAKIEEVLVSGYSFSFNFTEICAEHLNPVMDFKLLRKLKQFNTALGFHAAAAIQSDTSSLSKNENTILDGYKQTSEKKNQLVKGLILGGLAMSTGIGALTGLFLTLSLSLLVSVCIGVAAGAIISLGIALITMAYFWPQCDEIVGASVPGDLKSTDEQGLTLYLKNGTQENLSYSRQTYITELYGPQFFKEKTLPVETGMWDNPNSTKLN